MYIIVIQQYLPGTNRVITIFMSTLKMGKLRPKKLKFLPVHHWMSKERTPDCSSGLMLHPVLFLKNHTEIIQPLGGVGVV